MRFVRRWAQRHRASWLYRALLRWYTWRLKRAGKDAAQAMDRLGVAAELSRGSLERFAAEGSLAHS